MFRCFHIAIICWHEKHLDVLHVIHSPLVTFCLTFKLQLTFCLTFCLWLIVFVAMISLNDVFLRKVMTVGALNTFPNVLLIFDICQCLLIIFPIFGKVGLYVTENGIRFFRNGLVLFNRVDLSRLSNFSSWLRMIFSVYPFSTNRLTKSFECFLYSSKVEKHVFFLMLDCKEYSFLVKEGVQILHGDDFGRH